MKIFLIALGIVSGLILFVLILLSVKVGFYAETVYTKKDGFSFKGKITWLFLNKQIVPGKKTGKKKKKKAEKPKEKSDISVIKIIKYCATAAKELVWIPAKVLVFKKQCVWCKVALEDPMKNGITYGKISGALIGATQVLVCRFKTDEYKVRVTPDFSSKDGISIKDVTWIQVRPVVLIICLIRAYTKSPDLRNAIKGIKNELNKKKGSSEK